MFNPNDDEKLEVWFQRLQTPLKRLPADEQTRVQEKVRQHLEALAAEREKQGEAPEAAWRSALCQFGHPDTFGLRMAEEWRQSKIGIQADLRAIGFGLGLCALFWPLQHPLGELWFQSLRDAHGISAFPFIAMLRAIIGYGSFLIISSAIGFRYPLQALKGAFYSHFVWNLALTSTLLLQSVPRLYSQDPLGPEGSFSLEANRLALLQYVLLAPVWPLLAAGIAYLASVTRRGWYPPKWNDFKLTPPKNGDKLVKL